ncbi:MAG: hypothetical protein WAL31_04865 [Gaiellaceae bacterium]
MALLYDEIGRALSAQRRCVESLNARAQQLLGFATIILAILAAIVPTHPSVAIRILYAIALPVPPSSAGPPGGFADGVSIRRR